MGKILLGESEAGKAWIQQRYDELDEGRLSSLVGALDPYAGNHKEARDCIHYLWTNRQRMGYPKFHQQGFCTSTGKAAA